MESIFLFSFFGTAESFGINQDFNSNFREPSTVKSEVKGCLTVKASKVLAAFNNLALTIKASFIASCKMLDYALVMSNEWVINKQMPMQVTRIMMAAAAEKHEQPHHGNATNHHQQQQFTFMYKIYEPAMD